MKRFGLAASVAILGLSVALARPGPEAATSSDGLISVRSAYTAAESVSRLQATLAARGIRQFDTIDQASLAADVNIPIRASTLIVFGNPAIGARIIAARPEAGLDWPVRLLVHEDARGQVWVTYTAFDRIARRFGITNRQSEFETAAQVIASITASVEMK